MNIDGRPQSISALTANTELTRQAFSCHLCVLEDGGLVQSKRSGCKTLLEIDLRPFKDMNDYMNSVSSKWDQAPGRLKSFVEQ
mgnify:CR=1 FL=1